MNAKNDLIGVALVTASVLSLLKLFGVISWPWFLVSLPVWIAPVAVLFAALGGCLLVLFFLVVGVLTDGGNNGETESRDNSKRTSSDNPR